MRVGLPPGKGGPARHTQKWYNCSQYGFSDGPQQHWRPLLCRRRDACCPLTEIIGTDARTSDASLYACAWESNALFLSGQPAKTFQRQAEQGGHAQDQQRGPNNGCTGQREADAAEQRDIQRHANGTFGQQDQRGAGNGPPGDLRATPPARRWPWRCRFSLLTLICRRM